MLEDNKCFTAEKKKKCLERNAFASKRSRGLSEQCVGVAAAQLNTLRDRHVCGATLIFLGPKNCQTANKDFRNSPGNDIKGVHSYDIAPFHPKYVYHLYKKHRHNRNTQASKSSCNRMIFTLQNAVESTERSGMSEVFIWARPSAYMMTCD